MKNFYITLLFDYYSEILSDKQRDIFDSYYNADLSLSEIADNFGITRQGVRDFIKRTEQQLIDLEEKLGYCKKCEELKEYSKNNNIKAIDEKLNNLINNL